MASSGSLISSLRHSDRGVVSAQMVDDDPAHPFAPAQSILAPFVSITGTSGVDFIHEAGDGATPPSGGYNEIATATESSDTIDGAAGNDTIYGAGGDDILHGGLGDDVLNGGAGNDTAMYDDATAGVDIWLFSGPHLTGVAGTDTLAGIENLTGSAFNDKITGNIDNNILIGDGGSDQITGNGGNDTITGGSAGHNNLHGDGGDDVLTGGAGGNDTFEGDGGSDIINAFGTGNTAVFTSGHTHYNITYNSGTQVYTVAGIVPSSGDGTDTVHGVQFFQFTDGTYDPSQLVPAGPVNGTSGADFIHALNDGQTAPGGYNDINTATQTDDTISGLAGNDIIYGQGGNDTIDGGDNDDVVYGGLGNDAITGGNGNDVLLGGAGNNSLDGGAGFNFVSYSDQQAAIVDLASHSGTSSGSGSGSDTLTNIEYVAGSSGNDVIFGNSANNYLTGAGGSDQIGGRDGDDTLIGGDGDDRLDGGNGDDVIDGGAGNNTVDYRSSSLVGVSIDLRITTAQSTGGSGADTLSNIQNIEGSTRDDTLHGDDNANIITGNGGVDTIYGHDGNDTLDAGVDNAGSTLDGGAGNDNLLSGAGSDLLTGGAGNDAIDGGAGSGDIAVFSGAHTDYVISDFGSSHFSVRDIRGGSPDGTDTIMNVEHFQFSDGTYDPSAIASAGSPIDGTSGADFIHVSGDGAVAPGGYNDLATATQGNDTINGLAGGDIIYGRGGNDALNGGDGNDVVLGGAGFNALDGGNGFDFVSYSDQASATVDLAAHTGSGSAGGSDTLTNIEYVAGSSGNDVIAGDAANNYLTGDNGADQLTGRDGDDTLVGGAGDDSLDGGNGDDYLDGGAGNNTADYRSSVSAGVTVDLRISTAQNTGGGGSDTLINVQNIQGSTLSDTLTGDGNANVLTGNDGNDVLAGNAGNNSLLGGNGFDILIGGDGNDTLDGGAGSDIADYSAAAAGVTVNLAVTTAQNTVGAGADTITNIDYLNGSAFADTLSGDAASNFLSGNGGNDTLTGGGHSVGSGTGDTFAFRPGDGDDTITDFIAGDSDGSVIYLRGYSGVTDFASLSSHLSQSGADTVITLGASDHITLHNVIMGDLNSGDFLFG